jgi:hypothetical protein
MRLIYVFWVLMIHITSMVFAQDRSVVKQNQSPNFAASSYDDAAYILNSDGLKLRAYADVQYARDFNNPYNGLHRFNSSTYTVNQFDIGYAFVDFTYKKDRVRTTVAVHNGSVVDKMYEGDNEPWKQFREISGEYFFDHGFSIEVGNVPSHYGFEIFINKDNWFATRANMTDFAPDLDMAGRLNYRPNQNWHFRVQMANGWHTLRDYNASKAFGSLVKYEDQRLMVNWNTMISAEPFEPRYITSKPMVEPIKEFRYTDAPSYERYYSNFFMTYKWDRFWVAYLLDLGMGEHGKNSLGKADWGKYNFWFTTALCLKYFFANHWAIAGRVEYYYDPHSIVPDVITYSKNGYQLTGETISLEYAPSYSVTFRLEARYYLSKDKIFTGNRVVDLMRLEDQQYLKKENTIVIASIAYEFYQLFR